jgi:hypothetical protein
MGFSLCGLSWDAEEFRDYASSINLDWASSVTIHHTSYPDLKMRPNGWKIKHLENLRHYYQSVLGWSAGPHLFTDSKKCFGLSSLQERGVHAVSYNKDSIGIEMLGNYDDEDPKSGRGLDVINLTAKTVAILLEKMDTRATTETIKFHRDDPNTFKTCPGNLLEKKWFVDLVKKQMGENKSTNINLTVEERLTRIEKHLEI